MSETFAHHTIVLDDVRLHYVTAGSGDPIVLLHGWPQTWFEWRRIIPALASRYTVIAPDMRGLGDSSRPVTGYDKRTLAQDIYQLVHKLGFQQIYLVGHTGVGLLHTHTPARIPLKCESW
jgi:pimeloyl-ACP methyl ester carboxylesterase